MKRALMLARLSALQDAGDRLEEAAEELAKAKGEPSEFRKREARKAHQRAAVAFGVIVQRNIGGRSE